MTEVAESNRPAEPGSRQGAGPDRPCWWRDPFLMVFILLSLSVLWFSLGDHPLNTRSEGRYASVSLEMVQGGDWLVPRLRGQAHLTKPPMIYWAEALGLRLLGHNEWAVRAPSALAGTATLFGLLAFAWHLHGRRYALLAAGIFAVLPLHLVVSRLTLTDGLLGFCWFSVLACAVMAVRQPQRWRWPILLWCAVAAGWMTKAHVILLPLLVVLVWLLLARRGDQLRRLRPWIGLPLSLLPLVLWAGMIFFREYPKALNVWWYEIINCAKGDGDHAEPLWYFIPVFLAGLFPATLLLRLPGINFSWAEARQRLRRLDESALWALALIIPLVIFSIISQKLASYLLPLGPPIALLAATTLEGLLSGRWRDPAQDRRPIPLARNLVVIVSGICIAAVVLIPRRLGAAYLPVAWPVLPLLVLGVWLWRTWEQRPEWRGRGLALMWSAMAVAWLWGWHVEDRFQIPGGDRRLVAAIRQATGLDRPYLLVCGPKDDSLAFYLGRPVLAEREPDLIRQLWREHPNDFIVVADDYVWQRLERQHPEFTREFENVLTWPRPPLSRPRLVLRPRPDAVAMR